MTDCADLRRDTELAARGQALPGRLLPAHPYGASGTCASEIAGPKPLALTGLGGQLDTIIQQFTNQQSISAICSAPLDMVSAEKAVA